MVGSSSGVVPAARNTGAKNKSRLLSDISELGDNGTETPDLSVLRSPWLWPDYPFVRVERRTEIRPGQPFSIVVADETGEVVPAVYFVAEYPPDPTMFDISEPWGFSYPHLEAVVADGWRILTRPLPIAE